VYCKLREERYYPGHATAAALLGFTDKGIGLAGVEALYDPLLHPGSLSKEDFAEIDFAGEKNSGQKALDVILTLDLQLQKKIENQLEQYRKDTGAIRAMAIAMEPGTGKILAMVSQPGFDPNYFWHADEQSIRGQVVQKQYHAALIWPFFQAAVEIYDAGMNAFALPATVRAPEKNRTDAKTAKYWQVFAMNTDVSWPFAGSSNSGQIAAAKTAGEEERISGGQLAVGLSSIINGGKRVAPYVLDRVYDHDRGKFFARMRSSKGTKRILDPAQGVHLRMKLLNQPYYTHGKGFVFSNRIARVVHESTLSKYYNQEFFLGGVPRKRPKVILVMAVDHGDIFPLSPKMYQKKKNDETLSALGRHLLPALEQAVQAPKIADVVPVKSNENYQRFLISRRIELKKQDKLFAGKNKLMPDVTGMSLRKGLQQINALHLQVSIVGSGRIVRQDPAPGASLSNAGECRFFLDSRI
jgi:cell division protein FtsI (penicillin-binding protein 3)